jgi:cellulose synthase/poly-beta-1,6-N-acetylglucosamine synthase-like glycosyltransferase
MFEVAAVVAAAPLLIALYAYVGYPAILWVVARGRRGGVSDAEAGEWPTVTITIPVYNSVSSIRGTLEGLLQLDYPRDRLQLLVLSDASTDGTDAVVEEFASRGIELLRAPERRGKTAGENSALAAARGEIIVNVDATVVVPPASLKLLVRAFEDPTIGVASGCDISTGGPAPEVTGAESSYVGYEMWLRDLETAVGSIVGASGCFYGIRRCIHDRPLPRELSWDFASPLVAREKGFRSVSVREAVCLVPRTPQIRTEIRRKVRTMARGISTLFYHRGLMNPFRYGSFALMLVSHKLLRWLPYLLAPISFVALGLLATRSAIAAALFALVSLVLILGALGIGSSRWGRLQLLAAPGFAVAVFAAGFMAWRDALGGVKMATWDPTPRPEAVPGTFSTGSAL